MQLSISASLLPILRGAVSVLGEKPSQAKDFNRERRKHTHWGSHSNIITHRQQPISVGACLSSPPPWLVTEWMHCTGRSSGVGWGESVELKVRKLGSCSQMFPQLSEGSWTNVLLSLISGSLFVKWEDQNAVRILSFLIFIDCMSTETLLVGDEMSQSFVSEKDAKTKWGSRG